ncbi:HAD family hydrolase [Pilimelia columellifera subsp. columellifera]|uniref:HAD family hydrolase n=1 Tax=Pilimelia columellifera subsp. columellifera TaxID=706583 RepID=A0ABP6A400_9ACTN
MVGFDLDLTLVDSRPGVAAVLRELNVRTGASVDVDLVISRLGPPLRVELANWFPTHQVDDAVALYRSLYPQLAVARSPALPGAHEAVAAARADGGVAVVISAKIAPLVQLHLDHLGLTVDAVAGDRFGDGKSQAMADHGVRAYVGDHVADMAAAQAAGALGIGVATGPCTANELRGAGATVVLPGLVDLPGWLIRG